MSENIERRVTYVYSVVDDLSKSMKSITENSRKAGDESDKTIEKQKELRTSAEDATATIKQQSSTIHDNTSRTSKELLDASDNARRTSDEVNAIVNKQQTLRSQVEGTTAEIRNQASMVRDHNSDSSREMQEIINLSSSTEEYTSKSLSKQQDLRIEAEGVTAEIVRQFNVSKENFDAASKGLSTIDEGSRNASRETSNTIDKQRELKSEVESTTAIIERQSSVAHDNAIGTAEGMASASDSAIQTSADTDITIDKQRQLSAEARRSSDEIQVQQIGIITQLTAIMGFQRGISSLTRGVVQLGLVNDETAVKLMKFNTAFQMFAGGVQILKAAQGVMTILNLSTLKNAMLNTYNAVISNPGRAALVGVGIGAAAGVGTYYAMNSQNTNVNNNVVIEGTPSEGQQQSAQMVQQVYSLTGAGDYA